MAEKIAGESNVLTLDFWEEEVIYEGQVFPAGTLSCHALNIPDDVISKMETLCKGLNQFMGTFNSGKFYHINVIITRKSRHIPTVAIGNMVVNKHA